MIGRSYRKPVIYSDPFSSMSLFRSTNKRLDNNAPGPSPWYLNAPASAIESSEGKWRWIFDFGASVHGMSGLAPPSGNIALLLDFNCYVRPLAFDRMLIWHERKKRPEASHESKAIAFYLISLPSLQELSDPAARIAHMRQAGISVAFESENVATFEISTVLEEGTHPMSVPAEFSELEEQLVLADYSQQQSNNVDIMLRAIFSVDFRNGRVSVMPQHWFNRGPFDFGYVWITRVLREPGTGMIVGDGIRLGSFRLDPSGTNLSTWLAKDKFIRPVVAIGLLVVLGAIALAWSLINL